jgi:hypothetical protein
MCSTCRGPPDNAWGWRVRQVELFGPDPCASERLAGCRRPCAPVPRPTLVVPRSLSSGLVEAAREIARVPWPGISHPCRPPRPPGAAACAVKVIVVEPMERPGKRSGIRVVITQQPNNFERCPFSRAFRVRIRKSRASSEARPGNLLLPTRSQVAPKAGCYVESVWPRLDRTYRLPADSLLSKCRKVQPYPQPHTAYG